MSSLEYWQDRWAKAGCAGEGSWKGDPYARELEQRFVFSNLPHHKDVQHVVDLGCGAGALFEPTLHGSMIKRWVRDVGAYVGVDGSERALTDAQLEHSEPGFGFVKADLDQGIPKEVLDLEPGALVISKRTLQNLGQDARQEVIRHLTHFKHGIVLEATQRSLVSINELRDMHGHNPLTEPEFNSFLTDDEATTLGWHGARSVRPLSVYYAITRGILDVKGHAGAFQIACSSAMDGPFGILEGFVW